MSDQIQPGQNQDDELDVEELEEASGGIATGPSLEDDINGNCGVNCHC